MSLFINMLLHDNLDDLKARKTKLENELKEINEAIEKLEK